MEMLFTVAGLSGLSKLTALQPRLIFAVETAMHSSAQLIVKDIKRRMMGTALSSTGHSFPGEFPAIQTGQLSGSLRSVDISHDGFGITATANHAPYLQHGTYRMAARPFTSKGIELNLGTIEDTIIKYLKGALMI